MNKKEIKDTIINDIISYSRENNINVSLGLVSLIEKALDDYAKLITIQEWIAYDFNKIETRPKKYGTYFVRRKDGKVHWETWNGIGWAYNEKVITHYSSIQDIDGKIIYQS